MTENKKPELLAPAGDLEKLKTAVVYGADAVYIGGELYGLRSNAGNFTARQMAEGVSFAHEHGKRVFVAANIFARNGDIGGFSGYIASLGEMGADAVIVSDPGLLRIVRKELPEMEVHISTQANITNYEAVMFWHEQGARRVVLSRELSLAEIAEIREKAPEEMELECFVHGAMCLSYSGRCFLSQYMCGRDANKGDCSQPCRWKYALMEEKREGEYFPVFEDKTGAYILNSKDMCMVGHIPELVSAGIGSLKIEGRMKSAYYVASTVKAYRSAIDDYFESSEKYCRNMEAYLAEAGKTSHRNYFTGYYFKDGRDFAGEGQNTNSSSYIRGYDVVAVVTGYDEKTGVADVTQRNKFSVGETLEVLRQSGDCFCFTVEEMLDEGGEAIKTAPHAEQRVKIRVPAKVDKYNMLRRAQC